MRIVEQYRVVVPGKAPASFFQEDRAKEYARRYQGTVFAKVATAWMDPMESLPRFSGWRWEPLRGR